ncbi:MULTISPECIES: SHOCT domain-containing protein [unclassified Rhodococcus (in: high G+C Gram-positive bacteria)]|uniref:SHOCT domain-containing protein n=1 Tax=unclassified Rhodococcus (in: high G+C Gram-positive bacteria) TaxID=192944 RepID=UPI000717F3E5|nr:MULTISPECIES: SHOCT domain-containing protein [unclassified Rhodococcus (in: high G+C Gram-positive bacteria)]MBP2525027.1 soluble cytochrome b562 [Rhodococcus sp. PvP104]MDA3637104.1 SHOCT domain-containing protein [Rhodococcus sp. C-2]
MVFRGGRRGRPGLLGTVARTAVVAGTAKATSNAMDRRSQRKASEQQQEYQQQQPPPQQQVAPVQSVPPSGADDLVSKLQELGQLHQSGVLTDAEFAAAKAQLLS